VTPQPIHPIYIPSKSRAAIATTPAVLRTLGVPFQIIVEDSQHDEYAAVHGEECLLVLPCRFQEEYDPCMVLAPEQSLGSGPARNFAWEDSLSRGATSHWVMDDNIRLFARLHHNQRIPVGDGLIFAAMEQFVSRYENIALAGPQYWMFALSREPLPPFALNTRLFSCILIRNDLSFRWRARYNEDLDLSLRALKHGWATVLFNAFLQWKETTQAMAGGNTEAFYAEEGTLKKSQMIVDLHPAECRVVRRFGRWHHHADMRQWRDRPLIRRSDAEIPDASVWAMRKESRKKSLPG